MGKIKYYKTIMVPCLVGVNEYGEILEVEDIVSKIKDKIYEGDESMSRAIRDSIDYQDWLDSSEDDLRAAGSNYDVGIYKHASMLSYQAIEKGLKAYLIYVQGHSPDTHDLKWLVKLCIKNDERFEYYKGVQNLYTGYYTSAKYPTNKVLDISKDKTMVMMEEAAKLCGFVEDIINEMRGVS